MQRQFLLRSAITLVELTLGLAIAAIVVFGAIRAYYFSRENALYHQTVEMIGTVRGAVGARYGMTSDYSTVSPGKIIVSLPQSLVNSDGTGLITPYKSDAGVGPDTASRLGDSFYISLNNLPSDACSRLTRSDLGREAIAMRIDGANVVGPVNAATPLPLSSADQQTAAATCANAKLSSVSIQFGLGASSASAGGGTGGGVSPVALAAAIATLTGIPATVLGGDGAQQNLAAKIGSRFVGVQPGNDGQAMSIINSQMFTIAGALGYDQNAAPTRQQLDTIAAVEAQLIAQYVGGGAFGVDPDPAYANHLTQMLGTAVNDIARDLKAAGVPGY
jgi:hypothetical protein